VAPVSATIIPVYRSRKNSLYHRVQGYEGSIYGFSQILREGFFLSVEGLEGVGDAIFIGYINFSGLSLR
jgi:hypothetical protein